MIVGSTRNQFNPMTSIAWSHAGWADDPSWSRPADGGAVSSWRNQSGSGNNLTQGTGANQPIIDYDGLGGKGCVIFDGSNDTLSVTVSSIAQTYSIVLVAAADTLVANKFFFGPNGVSTQNSGGMKWSMFAGATLNSTTAADTSNHMFAGIAAGASSKLLLDGTSIVTGSGGSSTLTTIALGSWNTGTAWMACRIAFWGVYGGDITALGNWSAFKSWVQSYYGITLS